MEDDMKIEMEAGRNIQLDHIKEIMKENIPALIQENQNLKAELDKAVHKLSDYEKALKEYADEKNWYDNGNTYSYTIQGVYMNCEPRETGFEPAKRTLKKWEKENG